MERLLECVPNISEGSDTESLAAIAEAIDGTPGAWLLDQSADVDHARSVFTMAGEPSAVTAAMEASMAIAIERIDMRHQAGWHPRIGAVDVVPFVPVGDMTMEACVILARAFAATIAQRFDLPVYLYANAARRPERRILADIRRPGFEGLRDAMAKDGGAPDHGPRRPHETAGATAVGARPFLVAWNIQLRSTDIAVAGRIATRLRERGGGLPGIQALGLELDALDCVQVSMNVLDHARTPLWRVWEEVAALASTEGVSVRDSELVGLVPVAALEEVATHIGAADQRGDEKRLATAANWLQIRDFTQSMVFESRLASVRAQKEPLVQG
jgi:glutamate formiminotransferase